MTLTGSRLGGEGILDVRQMMCETCRSYSDCEMEPPKEGETCPYFEPRERLQLTFSESGWKMGEG